MPGGVANTTHGEGVRRGIGYAVGYKNVGFSEGFDDYSTARVRLRSPAACRSSVHTAAAEVGQGLVTVQAQIARTELAIEQVVVQTGHPGRQRRVVVGLPADLHDRRRGTGRLPGSGRACCAGSAARRGPARWRAGGRAPARKALRAELAASGREA